MNETNNVESVLGEVVNTTENAGTGYRFGLNCPLLAQLKKMDRPETPDIELIAAYKAGDTKAGFKLLVKHYKYILKLVIDITDGHWFAEDILQGGCLGLLEAARRFNPEMENTFLTYATSWIRKYIYSEVRNELLPMGGMALGRTAKERLYSYIKLVTQEKSDDEIMEILKINKKKLDELKILNITAARIKSLDFVPKDSEGEDVADPYNFADANDKSAMDILLDKELEDIVCAEIANLEVIDPTMAKILNYKLGTNGYAEKSKKEICEILNIKSPEYSKLERAGNKFLRKKLITAGYHK